MIITCINNINNNISSSSNISSSNSSRISVRRDSEVGIATRYGLDSLEIDSRSGSYLSHPTRVALEPTSTL